MSQQGPGGYGGGFGPPGGPGAPPGGFPVIPPGGPPGAPAGFGPQPPPIHPQYPAGGAPQPPKKTSPLVWVGVGCAVLLVLLVGSGAVAFFLAKRAANQGVAAALSAA
ncbi:MAG TPA: hypothetical protein VFZ53_30715, partial [Polyangiaceae bacterium]